MRPGLIAGPGDGSGRSGYWVARAARDDGPMLVPDILDAAVQAIHVDDLVRFTLDAIEQRRTGVYNAVGDRVSFGDWLEASRAVADHRGEVVAVSPEWLAEHGVAEWSGPDSLPLWIIDPEWNAFLDRSNAAAKAAGLHLRPLDRLLAETLEWERGAGPRPRARRRALPEKERELLAALRGLTIRPGSQTRRSTDASARGIRDCYRRGMATLSHDPLWPRAGGWPALADLEPGASVDLTLLGVPAWRTSLSPTNAHATPAAIREALRRYSPALMPDRASDAAGAGPRATSASSDSPTPATSTSPTAPRARRARSRRPRPRSNRRPPSWRSAATTR